MVIKKSKNIYENLSIFVVYFENVTNEMKFSKKNEIFIMRHRK